MKRTKKSLVLFVKARKYYSDRSSGWGEKGNSFTHRVYALCISPSGRIRTIHRVSGKTRKALSALDVNSRFDFGARFIAIRKSRGARPKL
jgi:hypothetical protein